MQFEWDEGKRERLLRERGIDLLDAALIFEGAVLTEIDSRADYGETRYLSTGKVDGEYFVVVHTARPPNVRLVTAWRAGRRARRRYQDRFPG
jgi:uncharacterized DUF497 family protein